MIDINRRDPLNLLVFRASHSVVFSKALAIYLGRNTWSFLAQQTLSLFSSSMRRHKQTGGRCCLVVRDVSSNNSRALSHSMLSLDFLRVVDPLNTHKIAGNIKFTVLT